MSKIMLDAKNEKLDALLTEGHALLSGIGIPVAPLDSIIIRYDKNKQKKHTATCTLYDNKYYITLHYKAKEEQEKDGKPFHVFRAILHELVHTCNDGNGSWLKEHNAQFMHYARMINEILGINIMATINPGDFARTHLPCIHRVTCPECGSTVEYYSQKEWKKDKEKYDKYGMMCSYCGNSNMQIA